MKFLFLHIPDSNPEGHFVLPGWTAMDPWCILFLSFVLFCGMQKRIFQAFDGITGNNSLF